jgi:hypothetical protein
MGRLVLPFLFMDSQQKKIAIKKSTQEFNIRVEEESEPTPQSSSDGHKLVSITFTQLGECAPDRTSSAMHHDRPLLQ